MTKPEKAGGPRKKKELDSFLDIASLFMDGVSSKDILDKKDILDTLSHSKKQLDNKKELLDILIDTLTTKYSDVKEETSTNTNSDTDSGLVAEPVTVPVDIFSHKLSGLEALVKYLRENRSMSLNDIAKQLNRDSTTIWTTYNRAKDKQTTLFASGKDVRTLSVATFADRRLSVFEWVVLSLHREGMRYSEIAVALNRDQRNIWTTVDRAKKKLGEKEVRT